MDSSCVVHIHSMSHSSHLGRNLPTCQGWSGWPPLARMSYGYINTKKGLGGAGGRTRFSGHCNAQIELIRYKSRGYQSCNKMRKDAMTPLQSNFSSSCVHSVIKPRRSRTSANAMAIFAVANNRKRVHGIFTEQFDDLICKRMEVLLRKHASFLLFLRHRNRGQTEMIMPKAWMMQKLLSWMMPRLLAWMIRKLLAWMMPKLLINDAKAFLALMMPNLCTTAYHFCPSRSASQAAFNGRVFFKSIPPKSGANGAWHSRISSSSSIIRQCCHPK